MKKLVWIIITSKSGKPVKGEWSRFGYFGSEEEWLAEDFVKNHPDYNPDS
jgi:hypothetical protein